MDPTETLLRERFESALAGVDLDVASLVGAGTEAGQRLRRRRRLQQGVASVAAVAVVAAGGLLGIHGGLFDNSAPPAGTVTQLVPSTPRGLAAAVMAHLPAGTNVVSNGGISSPRAPLVLEADLVVSTDAGSVQLNTMTAATRILGAVSCRSGGSFTSCRMTTLPDGNRMMTARQGARNWFVIVSRGRDAVAIQEVGAAGSAGGPPPIGLALLRAIGEDSLVGTQTSQAMIDAGANLADFTRSGKLARVTSSSGGTVSAGGGAPTTIHVPAQHAPKTAGQR